MELRQIKYFLAVADALHFHQAAEKLHLSQPSLSLQIHQLEEEIGVTLFERSKRRVSLTPAGMALMPRARQIMIDLAAAVREAQRAEQGLAGQLIIGFISSAMAGTLPQTLRTVQKNAPEVNIELMECSPEEQIQHLLHGTIDIGFVHAQQLNDDELSTLVVQRDALIMALPETLAPAEPVVDLRDYAQYASIMPAPFKSIGIFTHIQHAYNTAGVLPAKIVYTNLIMGGINSVSSGIGIALVPSAFRSVLIPGVCYRDLAQELPPIELLAVWKSASSSKPLARFIETLRQHAH